MRENVNLERKKEFEALLTFCLDQTLHINGKKNKQE